MPHASPFKGRNLFPLSKLKTMLQPTPSRRAWSEKVILQKSEKEQHFTVEVEMNENITTRTFMERFLDRDFFLTRTNQTFDVEVQFADDFTVHEDIVIRDLTNSTEWLSHRSPFLTVFSIVSGWRNEDSMVCVSLNCPVNLDFVDLVLQGS